MGLVSVKDLVFFDQSCGDRLLFGYLSEKALSGF
jgi:hypothetical protein